MGNEVWQDMMELENQNDEGTADNNEEGVTWDFAGVPDPESSGFIGKRRKRRPY